MEEVEKIMMVASEGGGGGEGDGGGGEGDGGGGEGGGGGDLSSTTTLNGGSGDDVTHGGKDFLRSEEGVGVSLVFILSWLNRLKNLFIPHSLINSPVG